MRKSKHDAKRELHHSHAFQHVEGFTMSHWHMNCICMRKRTNHGDKNKRMLSNETCNFHNFRLSLGKIVVSSQFLFVAQTVSFRKGYHHNISGHPSLISSIWFSIFFGLWFAVSINSCDEPVYRLYIEQPKVLLFADNFVQNDKKISKKVAILLSFIYTISRAIRTDKRN